MLNYARTRLATFIRTKSSLMITLRRRLREAIRNQEYIEKVLLPELQGDETGGDPEKVLEESKKVMDKWHHILSSIDKSEEYALIGEERPLKPIGEIAFFLGKLVQRLHEIHQNTEDKDVREIISGLIESTIKSSERLIKLFSEEEEDLHKEYLALLRQSEEKRGTLQNFVMAYNEVMEIMSDAWNERSKTRKVTSEEKSIEVFLKETLLKLESYVKSGKPAIKDLETECERLSKDVNKVVRNSEEMLNKFLFILKASSDLYLYDDEKDERAIENVELGLKGNKYPETDRKKFDKYLLKTEEKNRDSAKAVVDAFRRMARLESAELEKANQLLKQAA